MKKYWRKIRLFCSIVWRPCVSPCEDETWTLREHYQSLMTACLAWEVAGIIWDEKEKR